MSGLDRKLLEAAGLTASDVAVMLKRSRQAVSQGMAVQHRDYFGTPEITSILHDAKRRDFQGLEALQRFISIHYANDQNDLISFSRIADDQIIAASKAASGFIFVFNGNVDKLEAHALFGNVLRRTASEHDNVFVLVPGDWIRDYLDRTFPNNNMKIVRYGDASYLPSIMLVRTELLTRGFCFGVTGAEELTPADAQMLWQRLIPICPADKAALAISH